MSICSRCGKPIDFRYKDGKCIPIHSDGSCVDSTNSKVNDYSGSNIDHENTCFSTNCPECGDEVFFIRHNGGSVWLEPPLCPPWYKHGCFDNFSKLYSKHNLFVDYNISEKTLHNSKSTEIILGIIKATYVDNLKKYTDLVLETGKAGTKGFRVKNNAGFLFGKLCIYDRKYGEIWPIDEPAYLFKIYDHEKKQGAELQKCPQCNASLNPKNLSKHLRVQHGVIK